jgi:hypothetical protein
MTKIERPDWSVPVEPAPVSHTELITQIENSEAPTPPASVPAIAPQSPVPWHQRDIARPDWGPKTPVVHNVEGVPAKRSSDGIERPDWSKPRDAETGRFLSKSEAGCVRNGIARPALTTSQKSSRTKKRRCTRSPRH